MVGLMYVGLLLNFNGAKTPTLWCCNNCYECVAWWMPVSTKQNSSSKLSASANQTLFISIQSWVQKHAFDDRKNPNKIKIILKALKRIDFFGRLGTRKPVRHEEIGRLGGRTRRSSWASGALHQCGGRGVGSGVSVEIWLREEEAVRFLFYFLSFWSVFKS